MLSRLAKVHLLISLLCIAAISVLSRYSWDLSVYSLGFQNSSQVKCACNKCLTKDDDLWFRNLINASPKPFLSRKHTTSEEDFNWWKHVQRETHNFTFYKTTLDSLFQMFPYNPYAESSDNHCRTCAVVGNSGNLKRSHYGPLIDIHDIVIRMNHGRIKGYEADVGNKTTHHVMYPQSATQLDNSTHLVMFAFKINDLLWLLRKFNPGDKRAAKSGRIANKDLVMILNPAFMKYVHEMWLGKKGRYPSTGFMTILFSLLICDEVSVFGFGADSDGNWSHYFEILKYKKLRTGPHAGMVEYKIIQELHDKGIIRFFKGY